MSTNPRKTEARRRRFWTTAKVTVASLAAAAALTGGLAAQMASGNDPSLAHKHTTTGKANQPTAPSPVVTRTS